MRQIRVFVVAEIRLYQEGLARVLGGERRFLVVGTAGSIDEGIARMRSLAPHPDVALVDLGGPRGPAAAMALRDHLPTVRIIALGIDESEPDVILWAEAGVDGFVSQHGSLDDLLAIVVSVARGETLCSPRITAALLRHVGALARERQSPRLNTVLTSRERQIVALIDQGLCNKEIAGQLSIELPTVKNHVHHVLEKLGVHRRAEAAAALREPARAVEAPHEAGAARSGSPAEQI
jgi:DNA-binding NarL/FixJ family response regulator